MWDPLKIPQNFTWKKELIRMWDLCNARKKIMNKTISRSKGIWKFVTFLSFRENKRQECPCYFLKFYLLPKEQRILRGKRGIRWKMPVPIPKNLSFNQRTEELRGTSPGSAVAMCRHHDILYFYNCAFSFWRLIYFHILKKNIYNIKIINRAINLLSYML